MMITDTIIILLPIIYFVALATFLFFMTKITRVWILLGYGVFCGIAIFISYVFRAFDFISFNIRSGELAKSFFEYLQLQLSAGALKTEYLEVPGCSYGICLSIFSLISMIGCGIVLVCKTRWYSWLITVIAIILSFHTTAFISAKNNQKYIIQHNELREKCYTLIDKKLAQKISHQQIAKAIQENLNDFNYSNENLRPEQESSEKIIKAIQNL